MNKSKIIVIVLGIVIVAGSFFFNYKNNNSADSFEKIFSKFSDAISSQKFIREKIDGSFVIKDDKLIAQNNLPAGVYPKVNFSVNSVISSEDFLGNFDLINPSKDTKVSSNIKLSLENLMEDSVLVEADFIMMEQMLYYMKLTELSGVPMNISSIKSKWWKVDLESLIKNFAGIEADKILESMKDSQMSKEKTEQLTAIVKKYRSVVNIKKLSDGEIEGAPAYHFSATLDKIKLAKMFGEILDVLQKDSKQKQEIKNSDITKGLEMINIKSIELFVQKENYLPAEMKFIVDMSDESGKKIGTADMSFIISSSEPVEIKAPAGSTDIIYLFGNLMSGLSKMN